MADLKWFQPFGAGGTATMAAQVTLPTSPKTLLTVKAPTNQRVLLRGMDFGFFGTNNTAVPIQVDLRVVTVGSSASSAGAPQAEDLDMPETIQSVTAITFTAEPTYGGVLASWSVHPQTGAILSGPPFPVKIGGGKLVALIANAAVAVGVTGGAHCEE